MKLPSLALWEAFEEGRRFTSDAGRTYEMSVADAGVLCLPTGRIVLSDPLLDPHCESFTFVVEPDDYPVFISFADDEPALVMVQFAEGVPIRFEASDPPRLLVDSASAAFMDAKLARYLRRKAKEGRYDRYFQRFQHALEMAPHRWANHNLDRELHANVILCRTFGGDGSFPSFLGYDNSDRLVCLITDMFLEILGPD